MSRVRRERESRGSNAGPIGHQDGKNSQVATSGVKLLGIGGAGRRGGGGVFPLLLRSPISFWGKHRGRAGPPARAAPGPAMPQPAPVSCAAASLRPYAQSEVADSSIFRVRT